MKLTKIFIIVLAFVNTAQANTESISAQKVADLFVNPQVMECMLEVTKYNNKAEVYAGDVTRKLIGSDKMGQIAKTFINYSLIVEGDIMAGDIEVIITEEKVETFPWGFLNFMVTGCEVNESHIEEFLN